MPEVVFDRDKDAANLRYHNISLRAARFFDFDGALERDDDREDYGERRIIAIGRLNRDLYTLIYTPRGATVRAISLRRAERHEREDYLASR